MREQLKCVEYLLRLLASSSCSAHLHLRISTFTVTTEATELMCSLTIGAARTAPSQIIFRTKATSTHIPAQSAPIATHTIERRPIFKGLTVTAE